MKKTICYTICLSTCWALDNKLLTGHDSSPGTLKESKSPSTLRSLGKLLFGSRSDLDDDPYQSNALFQVDVGAFCLQWSETDITEKKSLENCGDDAFFISKENTHRKYFGVADGVSGRLHGNSREISTSLMKSCNQIASAGNLNAASVLQQGYSNMIKKKPNVPGSTTATIVSIQEKNGVFDAANFGDSGFLILRNNSCLLRSIEMIQGFNYPIQLKNDLAPTKPDTYQIYLEDGDIIILATDGLWDNLFIKDVFDMVNHYIPAFKASNNKSKEAAKLAELFARESKRRALLPCYISPFAIKAKHANIEKSTGKNDDTTVLVAYVNKKQ